MRRSRASEQKIIRWKRMTLDYGKTERSRVMEGKLRVSGYKERKARVYFLLHHDSTDLKYYCICKSQIFSRIILLKKLSPSTLTLSYLLQLSDTAADYCLRNSIIFQTKYLRHENETNNMPGSNHSHHTIFGPVGSNSASLSLTASGTVSTSTRTTSSSSFMMPSKPGWSPS
jgi:hypothetical protein